MVVGARLATVAPLQLELGKHNGRNCRDSYDFLNLLVASIAESHGGNFVEIDSEKDCHFRES